ncbi:MAG: hypothetical protein F7C34_04080 [Desulfurococcales archaeon]|nr:hypothetical protein [Desulfurococcales archaeon]
MPVIEAGAAIVRGRVLFERRMPAPLNEYYDVVVTPGFSDTHAHPQVIDAGIIPGVTWNNSYEWLLTRRMVIDEASVRNDIGLASSLAGLTLKRALLEGTTLIALTGSFDANIKAFVRLKERPRTVLLPTVMKKRGWATPNGVADAYRRYAKYARDDFLRIGVFVHSIKYAGRDMLHEAIQLAMRIRGPLGIHLSEGVPEKEEFIDSSCCLDNVRVVGVHCLNDDYSDLGIRCSSCPGSNLLLYEKYVPSLGRVTSFGSDWPHFLGTIGGQIGLITELYRDRLSEALFKATVGGYLDYNLNYSGDLVAFDGSIRDVLSGRVKPRLVVVNGIVVVYDGRLVSTGESLGDVLKALDEVVDYAVEVHGIGEKPVKLGLEDAVERARRVRRASVRSEAR